MKKYLIEFSVSCGWLFILRNCINCEIHIYHIYSKSYSSTVGVVTGYRLDGWGGRSSSSRFKNFYFSISFKPALGPTKPPIQWVGARDSFLECKAAEVWSWLTIRLQLMPKVNKTWICISTQPYVLIAQCLVKHRYNFTFIFTLPYIQHTTYS
jgi:hypothetical protein